MRPIIRVALLCLFAAGVASLATKTQAEPQSEPDMGLLATLAATPEVSYFTAMIERAQLGALLEQDGPFTVFAPIDDAFLFMDAAAFDALLEDPERLRALVLAHVVEGHYSADALLAQGVVTTLDGASVRLEAGDRGPLVGEAAVLAEVPVGSGAVYLIPMLLGELAASPPS